MHVAPTRLFGLQRLKARVARVGALASKRVARVRAIRANAWPTLAPTRATRLLVSVPMWATRACRAIQMVSELGNGQVWSGGRSEPRYTGKVQREKFLLSTRLPARWDQGQWAESQLDHWMPCDEAKRWVSIDREPVGFPQ